MRKELMSFLAVFLLGLSVVLGILLLNTKRENLQLARSQPAVVTDQTAEKQVLLPQPRSYRVTIELPAPKLKGTVSVEQALAERRTERTFEDQALTLPQLSQMLWAAQGVTDEKTGKRTAPSAYEVYPFSVYVLVRDVKGVEPGLYEYLPEKHALGAMPVADANSLFNNAGVQAGAKTSPVVVLLSAAMDKGYEKMKERSVSSAYLEGGHIAENMYLQAESLKLGLVVMGGSGTAAEALKLDPAEKIVYVIPMGVPAVVTAEATEEK